MYAGLTNMPHLASNQLSDYFSQEIGGHQMTPSQHFKRVGKFDGETLLYM